MPGVVPPPSSPGTATRRFLAAGPDARRLAGALGLGLICAGAMAASLALAPGPAGLTGSALVPLVAAIAVIDARRFIIPDGLILTGLLLGLAHAAAVASEPPMMEVAVALARGAVLALLFLALRAGYRALRGREGLGLGDVKLAAVAGVWLQPETIPLAVEIAALSALAAWGMRALARRRSRDLAALARERLPFGLFFAPAIWLGWLAEQWPAMTRVGP